MHKILFHAAMFGLFAYGIYYDLNIKKPPKGSASELVELSFGGRGKYLTFLNLWLQCVYFFVALLANFQTANGGKRQAMTIQKLRDFLFTTIVFPVGVFVSFIFWALYAVDRELIFPVHLDEWFPLWLNHLMHTLPVVACFSELYLVHHSFPASKIKQCTPAVLVSLVYLAWMSYASHILGFWIYPVFNVVTGYYRIALCSALLIPSVVFQRFGEWMHIQLWSKHKSRGQKKESSKRK